MSTMSQVDFMLGILTSLIATILFELRFVLMKSTKWLGGTIRRAWVLSPLSLKMNLLTLILIPLFLAGVIRFSTQIVLAPSDHFQLPRLAASEREIEAIRAAAAESHQEIIDTYFLPNAAIR